MRIRVVHPGVFATIQDLGRPGLAAMGVPLCGAADPTSLRIGNRLLANPDDAAAIEMTITGCDLAFEGEPDEELLIVLAGSGTRGAMLTSPHHNPSCPRPVAPWEPTLIRPGDRLRCGTMHDPTHSVRGYLCIRAGINVPRTLASRSTHARAGLGGHEGRPLRDGDVLSILPTLQESAPRRMPEALRPLIEPAPAPEGRTTILVTPGPHANRFVRSPAALLDHIDFTISPRSDRMGLRLEGAALPTPSGLAGGRLPSEPMPGPGGAIQVPPDGHPIVLMPDGPTTGGYPVIATVAAAHLPALGRLGPGARVRFLCVSEDRARDAWRRQEQLLARELPALPRALLNADVGEDPSAPGLARDRALLEHLDLIHIACAGHAGDEPTMRALVQAAQSPANRAPILIGAHPSYPDRPNFGRARMTMPLEALRASVRDQIATLHRIAHESGARLRTIKPHGALYHDCADPAIANAVAHGARDALGDAARACYFVAQAASPAISHWRAVGWPVLEEGFADRTYRPDGTLTPRSQPDSLIEDPAHAARQARALLERRGPELGLSPGLSLAIDTLCIHSDTPGALRIAPAVHQETRA